jgi:hypothetical protein
MKSAIVTVQLTVIFLILFSSCVSIKKTLVGSSVNESTEWSNTFIVGTDKTNLPKVLLIGDSHVERYYPVVTENLNGKAYCSKFTTSRSLGDSNFIEQLDLILKKFDFDVICFNNGLHGEFYSVDEYKNYLPVVYNLIKKKSKKGIIWINTTAIRKRNSLDEFHERNNQIVMRNKVCLEFTTKNQIPLLDFYTASLNNKDYYTNDGIHFNETGVKAQAELLCVEINKKLKK